MEEVSNTIKVAFNHMVAQLISFAIISALAYVLTFIILLLIKVPGPFAKLISLVVMLMTMYYSYNKIFLL